MPPSAAARTYCSHSTLALQRERHGEDERHRQKRAEGDALHDAERAAALLVGRAERGRGRAGHQAVTGPSHAAAAVECADSGSEGWNMPASTSR